MAASALYSRVETINQCNLSVVFEQSDGGRSVEFSWGGLVVCCSLDGADVERIGRIGNTVFGYLEAAAKKGKRDYTALTNKFEGVVQRYANRLPAYVRPRLDRIATLFEEIIQGKEKSPESIREITEEEAKSRWQIVLPRTIKIAGPEGRMTDDSIKTVLEAFSDYIKIGQDSAQIKPWDPAQKQLERMRKVMAEELVRVYERTGLMIAEI